MNKEQQQMGTTNTTTKFSPFRSQRTTSVGAVNNNLGQNGL